MEKKRPTRTLAEYAWFLKNTKKYYPSICIDIGSGAGTDALYISFKESRHICVEPLKHHLPALRQKIAGYEHKIFNVGVLEKPGRIYLRDESQTIASALATPGQTGNFPVKISTIDEIMDQVDWTGSILMKTDCQGTDLLALKGAMRTLQRCDVVIVETPLFRFWGDHQGDFYDTVHFMKTQGFVVHDLIEGLFRPNDRALGQIDISFVKEAGIFRLKRNWS